MDASVESEVLIKYYDKIQTMIQGEIQALSAKALAQHLLSTGEHSKCVHPYHTADVQTMYFMQAVRNKVDVNPGCFDTFLGLLKKQPAYKFLVDMMEAEVKEMKIKRPAEAGANSVPGSQPTSGDSGDGIDYDSIDGTTVLNCDDLFDILGEIEDITLKFYQLGQSLHVSKIELDIIKSNHSSDPKTALMEVVAKWLDQMYPEKYGEPTWRALAKGVAHSFGGSNGAVARKIAKNHMAESPPQQ